MAGAALRFAGLELQSYWFDETATTRLLSRNLDGLLEGVANSESAPPLYYIVAWLWSEAFGTAEFALRSLSALAGTATIPVAYAAAARLKSKRAGLYTAALTALSPLLIWYSQEARAYALLVLLSALSFYFFSRCLEDQRGRPLALWAMTSSLALATHYFALFLVAAEVIWLLIINKGRGKVLAATLPVAIVGVALIPLLDYQRTHGGASFAHGLAVSGQTIGVRLEQLPQQFLAGYNGPGQTGFVLAIAALVLFGLWLIARYGQGGRPTLVAASVGLAGVAVPVVMAVAGADYLTARNLLFAWVPLAAAFSCSLASVKARTRLDRPLALACLASICALFLAVNITVIADSGYQRDNWRGAERAIAQVDYDRVLVVSPRSGEVPLYHYLPRTHPLRPCGVRVRELVLAALPTRRPGERPRPPRQINGPVPIEGFREAGRVEDDGFTVVFYRSKREVLVTPSMLSGWHLGGRPATVLVNLRLPEPGAVRPSRGQCDLPGFF